MVNAGFNVVGLIRDVIRNRFSIKPRFNVGCSLHYLTHTNSFSFGRLCHGNAARYTPWIKPPPGYMCVNGDANKDGFVSIIIRDYNGKYILGFTKKIEPPYDSFKGEVMVQVEIARITRDLGIRNVASYTDNDRVSGLINGKNPKTLEKSRFVKEIKEIRELMNNKDYFDNFFVRHTLREGNQASDELADWARDSEESPHVAGSKASKDWSLHLAMDPYYLVPQIQPPSKIEKILETDANGVEYPVRPREWHKKTGPAAIGEAEQHGD